MTKGLYAYDVFGNPLITASHVDNDFQYTGEQVDDETGLIYLRARYYDPEIGRFISRDPFAGFDTAPQSLNRYVYVQNNPVVYTDPSGMVGWAALVPGAIGIIANTGWYIGMDVVIGGQPLSPVKLAGRVTGGAVAPYVGIGVGLLTKNPIVVGAAIGESSYLVDRWTQGQLSSRGVRGSTDSITPEGAGVSLVGGGAARKITNRAIPFSPKNTDLQRIGQAGIFRTGMATMNFAYNAAPGAYNYVMTSNQEPIRLSSSGSFSAGKLK